MLNRIKLTLLACTALGLAGCNTAPTANGSVAATDNATTEVDATAAKLTVPSGTYTLDPSHSILQWSVNHFGTSDYHAKFTKVDATLKLDAADLEKSSIKFVVKADSIRTDYPADYKKTHATTGYDTWDAELGRSPKFMDGTKNPDITFESTKIEKTGNGTGRVTGNLTFRGVSKPITLKVRLVGQKDRHPMLGVPVLGFEAEGEVVRVDFGMPKDMLGASAKIYFNGEFDGEKPGSATAPAGN